VECYCITVLPWYGGTASQKIFGEQHFPTWHEYLLPVAIRRSLFMKRHIASFNFYFLHSIGKFWGHFFIWVDLAYPSLLKNLLWSAKNQPEKKIWVGGIGISLPPPKILHWELSSQVFVGNFEIIWQNSIFILCWKCHLYWCDSERKIFHC